MDERSSLLPDTPSAELNLNKILVVDDTVENLQLLQLIFRKTEFEVLTASNGAEGLQVARTELPFLVLSDIQMPRMDGYTFCRELKSTDPTRNISVIFITSHAITPAQVSKGLELGADEYINRPIERKELLARVRAVARLKRAELTAHHEAQKTAQENRELARINAIVEEKVIQRTNELQQEKTKLETILKTMADGVLVLDAQRKIVKINDVAASLLNIATDVTEKTIDDAAFRSVLWDNIRQLTTENTQKDEFVQMTRPNGTKRSVQIYASPIIIDNNPVGWTIVLNDVSAILEAEQMKVRFMTGITHELKTPLSIIRLHSENMLKYNTRLSPEQRAEMLTGIRNQTDLLSSLIDDVLTLVKLDTTTKSDATEAVPLDEVISQSIAKVSPLAADKNIRIQWKPGSEKLPVQIPTEKLSLVVGNLIENAIKYTPAGSGKIVVEAKRQQKNGHNSVTLTVTDSGIGIDPADQQRIFDRFFRADTAHTIPGTGLGLAIVKEIVLAHGGDIGVVSNRGHGSTFTVTLPLAQSA